MHVDGAVEHGAELQGAALDGRHDDRDREERLEGHHGHHLPAHAQKRIGGPGREGREQHRDAGQCQQVNHLDRVGAFRERGPADERNEQHDREHRAERQERAEPLHDGRTGPPRCLP